MDKLANTSLAEQLRLLERAKDPPDKLLLHCAGLPDHSLLARYATHLLERGWFGPRDRHVHFALFLLEQPDSAIHRLLEAFAEAVPRLSPKNARSAAEVLVTALGFLPLERLPILCLINRMLGRLDPGVAREWEEKVADDVRNAIARGDARSIPEERLVQLHGRFITPIRKQARELSDASLKDFDRRRAEVGRLAIERLGALERAIGQSFAENMVELTRTGAPARCLLALLENADDTGASKWRVRLEPEQLVIWHNGHPFSALDVTALTLLGVGGAGADRIGAFSTGFRSVFQLSTRPAVYSDVYRFELLERSLPHPITARPKDTPRDGTLIVLPLDAPHAEDRSSQALFDWACQLKAFTLLNLHHVQSVDFKLTAPEARHHAIKAQRAQGASAIPVKHVQIGPETRYLLIELPHSDPDAKRPSGRRSHTTLRLGISLDDSGCPIPAPSELAHIYRFIPTDEATGLRFVLHADFDTTPDRSFLTDSPWNRSVLRKLPELFAMGIEGMLDAFEIQPELPASSSVRKLVGGFLNVLPLADELGPGHLDFLPDAFAQRLAHIPFLPTAEGRLAPPSALFTVEPELNGIFRVLSLPGALLGKPDIKTLHALDPDLEGRQRRAALSLITHHLDLDAFVALLGDLFTDLPNPSPVQTLPSPQRTLATQLQVSLFTALATWLLRLESKERTHAVSRIRKLVIIPASDGQLYRPLGELCPSRCNTTLRPVFRGLRPLLAAELDPLDAVLGPEVSPHLVWLWTQIGLPRIELENLIVDLESHTLLGTPLHQAMKPLLDDHDLLRQLLEQLAYAPLELQLRARHLALFLDTQGTFHQLGEKLDEDDGLIRVTPRLLDTPLGRVIASARPILDPSLDTGLVATLLNNLDVPKLTLESVVDAILSATPPVPTDDPNVLKALLDTLALHAEHLAQHLPRATLLALSEQPFFPDTEGARAPLSSWTDTPNPERIYRASPQARTLLANPDRRWLHPDVEETLAPLLRTIPITSIEDRALYKTLVELVQNASAQLQPRRMLDFLVKHATHLAKSLPPHELELLLALEAFPDAQGELGALCHASQPLVRAGDAHAVLEVLGTRVLDPEFELHLAPVLEAAGVYPVPVDTVVDALEDCEPADFESHDERLRLAATAYLLEHLKALEKRNAQRVCKLPLFLDDNDDYAPLGPFSEAPSPHRVYAAPDTWRHLFLKTDRRWLRQDEHERWQPLVALCSPTHDDAQALLTEVLRLETAEHVVALDDHHAQLLLDHVLEHTERLAHELPHHHLKALTQLLIFPDEEGQRGALGRWQRILKPHQVLRVIPLVRDALRIPGRRFITPALDSQLRPLFDVLDIVPANLATLFDLLQGLTPHDVGRRPPPHQSTELLLKTLALLSEHKDTLSLALKLPEHTLTPRLSPLPIWPTRAGAVLPASDVIVDPLLDDLFAGAPTGDNASGALLRRRILPEAEPFAQSLSSMLSFATPREALRTLVETHATDNAKLEQQPHFLSSPERVARVVATLQGRLHTRDFSGRLPLLIDTRGRLTRDPLHVLNPTLIPLFDDGSRRLASASTLEHIAPHLAEPLPEISLEACIDPLLAHTSERVQDHPLLARKKARKALYTWLLNSFDNLLYHPHGRTLLLDTPIFASNKGRLHNARALQSQQRLGNGPKASPEIPEALLERLTQTLDTQSRGPDDAWILQELTPALIEALEASDRQRIANLLSHLNDHLHELPQARWAHHLEPVAALDTLRLENRSGNLVPAHDILVPPPSLNDVMATLPELANRMPAPSIAPLAPTLLALGARSAPDLETFTTLLHDTELPLEQRVALVHLINANEALHDSLPLDTTPWLLDRDGHLRPARELFWPELHILELLGLDATHTLLHEDLRSAISPTLRHRLTFRRLQDIALSELTASLVERATAGRTVDDAVYTWLEQGLRDDRFTATELRELLSKHAWILADDGRYWPASRCVATPSFHLFGRRVGYWLGAPRRFPLLIHTFDIPTELEPDVVLRFLEHVHEDVIEHGDQNLLLDVPELPRLLLGTAAFLGRHDVPIPPNLRVVLAAHSRSENEGPAPHHLCTCDTRKLFVNDTPHLLSILKDAGVFRIAHLPDTQEREHVARCYALSAIPSLQKELSIQLVRKASDNLAEWHPAQLVTLRGRLRALLVVMPRVRDAAAGLPPRGLVLRHAPPPTHHPPGPPRPQGNQTRLHALRRWLHHHQHPLRLRSRNPHPPPQKGRALELLRPPRTARQRAPPRHLRRPHARHAPGPRRAAPRAPRLCCHARLPQRTQHPPSRHPPAPPRDRPRTHPRNRRPPPRHLPRRARPRARRHATRHPRLLHPLRPRSQHPPGHEPTRHHPRHRPHAHGPPQLPLPLDATPPSPFSSKGTSSVTSPHSSSIPEHTGMLCPHPRFSPSPSPGPLLLCSSH